MTSTFVHIHSFKGIIVLECYFDLHACELTNMWVSVNYVYACYIEIYACELTKVWVEVYTSALIKIN